MRDHPGRPGGLGIAPASARRPGSDRLGGVPGLGVAGLAVGLPVGVPVLAIGGSAAVVAVVGTTTVLMAQALVGRSGSRS